MSDEATSDFEGGLVLDLSGIADAPEREALRAGTYPCELVEFELTESKKGDPMLKWVYQTTDEELENRRFWNYTLLNNEIGLRITRDHIVALNPEMDLSSFDPESDGVELIGRPCRVTVDRGTYNKKPTNNVKAVRPPSESDFLS